MATIEYKETCALCGQAVEIKEFTLNDKIGIKKFCCLGCLSIYQLLNPSSENTTINKPSTTIKKETPK